MLKRIAILLIACTTICWADVTGQVTSVDAGAGTLKVSLQGEDVRPRDVFVVVRDGAELGECLVVSVKGAEATLITRPHFKGAARKGDAVRFVRHAAAVESGSTSMSSPQQQALFARLRQSVASGATTRTKAQGMGDVPFEDVCAQGGVLVGFDISYNKFFSNYVIKSIQPIYETASGRTSGKLHAGPAGLEHHAVTARAGYAVGAVTVKSGLTVDGFSVTFMKIEANGLNARDKYESDWQGGPGGGSKQTLGGDGNFVVGVFGRLTKDTKPDKIQVASLGLIQAR